MPRVVSSIALPPQPVPDRIKVLHVITNFTTGAGGNTLLSAMTFMARVAIRLLQMPRLND